jgi:hypothetical protein
MLIGRRIGAKGSLWASIEQEKSVRTFWFWVQRRIRSAKSWFCAGGFPDRGHGTEFFRSLLRGHSSTRDSKAMVQTGRIRAGRAGRPRRAGQFSGGV